MTCNSISFSIQLFNPAILHIIQFTRPIIDDIPMSAHEDGNSTFSSESFHTEPGFDEKLAGKYLIVHHRIFTSFLLKS